MSRSRARSQQRHESLQAVDVLRERRCHGRLIATPGADFQNPPKPLARLQTANQYLGHARDDVRLGDGLTESDRQRRVFVGATRQRLVHEQVSRYVANPFKHADCRCPHRATVSPTGFASGPTSCRCHERSDLASLPRAHTGVYGFSSHGWIQHERDHYTGRLPTPPTDSCREGDAA